MAASGIKENELPSQAYFAERFNISDKTMDRLNWSIAELLRKDYAHLRLRTVVISSALFKNVTLGSLLSDRFGPPCVRVVVRRSTFPLFLRWAG